MLATKVRQARRRFKASQEVFAEHAGIPLRTYKRFETHGRASLETFIQVLKALDRTSYLALLFPESAQSSVAPVETHTDLVPRPEPLIDKVQRLRALAKCNLKAKADS